MNVLFPQPDGPITAVMMFRYTSRSTSLIAVDAPYETVRPSTSKTISRSSGTGVFRCWAISTGATLTGIVSLTVPASSGSARAACEARLPQRWRDEEQHLLRRTQDERQHHDCQCERAGERALHVSDHEQAVDEDPGHDRRHAVQDVETELHERGDATRRELGQVDGA